MVDCAQDYESSEITVASLRRDLATSPYLAIRGLVCDVNEGRLTLAGSLPNFHTRQVALSIVARHCDTAYVEDQIHVRIP